MASGEPLDKRLLKRALFPARAAPVQIGRFTVLKPIGQGGMGVVYACYDDQLDRKVAVKVLRVELLHNHPHARMRLLREAQAMARLSHPNIVTVHEVEQARELVYVAMEFVRGVSLDVWAAQPRPWREVLAAFIQAGRGLAAAHRAGIVHRDFKPQNVMISDEGLVKVLDFGLARATDNNINEDLLASRPDGITSSNATAHLLRPLTRTGLLLGTPAYMSPEQHCGEQADAVSDQFSFCVSLYQSLYGALPFSATSFEALRSDVIGGRVAPAPVRSPVPPRIFKVLRRGMRTAPGERFATMELLLAALERDPGRTYRRAAALVLTAAVASAASVAVLGGGATALEQCPDATPELAETWDPHRAATIRAALTAVGSPRAAEVHALVEPRLARYAAAWVQMRNAACLAHVEGRQSAHVFDLRTMCLDQCRASLDAVTDALATADAASLEGLLQAVDTLPPLDTCEDIDVLTATIPVPADAPTRAQVQRHRETLARAEVREFTGQTRPGLLLVDPVLADARALAFEPLLAEGLLRRGSLLLRSGDFSAARPAFDEALWTALGAMHSPVAALAAARRGFLVAHDLGRPADALADLPLIRALGRQVRRNVDVYCDVLNAVGVIYLANGDGLAARNTWDEAVALRERHGRLETPQGIGTLFNIGVHLQQSGRYEAAMPILRRVLLLAQELSGPNHPDRMIYEGTLAHGLVRLGRPREALELMRQMQARARAVESNYEPFVADYGLAEVEFAMGDISSARQHLIDVQRATPEFFEPRAWAFLMRVAAADGDAVAMEHARDRALAGLPPNSDPRGPESQDILLMHGQALADLGRLREALEPLERARAALVGSDDPTHLLRRGRIALQLGHIRHELHEDAAANQELLDALTLFEHVLTPRNLELADTTRALGELALADHRPDEALSWLTRALSIYTTTAEPDYPPLARTRAALSAAEAAAPSPGGDHTAP